MVSEPKELPVFASYLEDIKILKENFISLEIIHVPKTQNIKQDSLARSDRRQTSFVVHMDTEHPTWCLQNLFESVLADDKKKHKFLIFNETLYPKF